MNLLLGSFELRFWELLTRIRVSSPQVGLSSFHQQAIYFLCTDLKWACQIWSNFSTASPDIRLSLFTWVLDGQGLQQTSLKEVIQRVLQVRNDLLPRLQYEQNNLSKNQSYSFLYNNRLKPQCKETGEAKIGLSIMAPEAEIWLGISFSPQQKKECI